MSSSAASTPTSNNQRRSAKQRDDWSTHSGDTESYVSNSDLDASMPSHAYRELRGLPSNNVLKQNMKRTLKERRPKSRGRLETDSAFSVDNEAVVNNEEDVFRGMNLSPDDYANLVGRQRDLKEMPTSIRRKRTIKCV